MTWDDTSLFLFWWAITTLAIWTAIAFAYWIRLWWRSRHAK
jgi:hypothetical protein